MIGDSWDTLESRAYTDLTKLTDHPGSGWTRFVCISDTHSREYPIPEGDVLIHAGDLTGYGTPEEVLAVVQWLRRQPHPIKLIVAGNHDLILDPEVYEGLQVERNRLEVYLHAETLRCQGFFYLEHESATIQLPSGKEWKVYGSPSSPIYRQAGAFQYPSKQSAEVISNGIPVETQILITHTPPLGILDTTRRGKQAGCQSLAHRLTMLPNCRLHAFGHIHEAFGAVIVSRKDTAEERVSVNAACPISKRAIVVDIQDQ